MRKVVSDPYKVLGVSRDASPDEIKKAYRQKAKQYHPDLHPDDPHASEKMNEINEAYDMITNPQKYQSNRYYGNASNGSSSGSSQTYGNPYGTWRTYYYGTGPQNSYGSANSYKQNEPSEMPGDSERIKMAVSNIRLGNYLQALSNLDGIPGSERNARWYYLSALANYGSGNQVMALQQIQVACQLDPRNPIYETVYRQFKQPGSTYRTSYQPSNNTGTWVSRILRFFLLSLCLRFCCCYC